MRRFGVRKNMKRTFGTMNVFEDEKRADGKTVEFYVSRISED